MLRSSIATAALFAILSASQPSMANKLPEPPTTSFIGDGQTTIGTSLSTEGKPSSGSVRSPSPDSSSGATVASDPCWYTPVEPQLNDSRLGGDAPTSGILYAITCPEAINLSTGKLVYFGNGSIWVRNGQPLAPPAPDPGQIAEQASGQITVPLPAIHLGPDAGKLAVKVPIWLWVDSPAPLTVTVAVRGLAVTVVASLESTTWSMGEPIDQKSPLTKVISFNCSGPGIPAPAAPDPQFQPACGYTYNWKSLNDRTGGSGSWSVTATANWRVRWTASNGTQGQLAKKLTPSTSQQVTVGEWRSTLVANPGG